MAVLEEDFLEAAAVLEAVEEEASVAAAVVLVAVERQVIGKCHIKISSR